MVEKKTMPGEKFTAWQWGLIGSVVLFLFWAPFQVGLFNGNTINYESPIYTAVCWMSITLVVLAGYFFKIWRLEEQKDWLSLLVLGLPLTYFISLSTAGSSYYAMNMVYIQFVYVALFLFGAYVLKHRAANRIIQSVVLITGYLVVWYGMIAWFGHAKLTGSLVSWLVQGFPYGPILTDGSYNQTIWVQAIGHRLSSVFQYPNTYAGLLIALMFCAVFMLVKSQKWYVKALNAFMLVPIIISFFLTLSRGAIVLVPIAFLFFMFFQKPYRQILWVVHLGIAFVISLAFLGNLTDTGLKLQEQFSSSLAAKGWLTLLGVSLLYTVVAVLIERFIAPWLEKKLEGFTQKKWSHFALPVAAIIIGGIAAYVFIFTSAKNIFPESIKSRLESINFQQHSALERVTFYKDAMKLLGDYPAFGAGGGAWAALYEKYQHNPYTSRQAHNFAMQYLAETGIVGFLILVAFLALILYFFIRSYIRSNDEQRNSGFLYFMIAVALFAHSMLDFDLSYVYLSGLVFLCLGGMIANTSTPEIKKLNHPSMQYIYPSVVGVLAVVMVFVSFNSLTANASYKTANRVLDETKNYNETVVHLDKALSKRPTHPEYAKMKITLLRSAFQQTQDEGFYNEGQQLLDKVLKKEAHNRILIELQILQYEMKGMYDEALQFARAQLADRLWDTGLNPDDPKNITLYERIMMWDHDLGEKARTEQDSQNMNAYWDDALAVYGKLQEQMKILESLPEEQNQGRAFGVTPKMALAIGQIHFKRGDYAAASETLKLGITQDYNNEENRIVIRWYLASLLKQNTNDQALHDALISADPNEQQMIDELVNTNFAL
ncbi:hypothetical protein PAE9249_04898 [Paenibacillus sp. CECT 9249]|uniref:O-antigen ligase family protein n=1 Tax=Paenibacillus sp. CECT 9249 TaxID=2845385 RepID=UPI001E51185B|nr:O-antigen ligase family protein [Paenibacillus sp. CECT 9249]CAH0122348.1 hypothetical protein PAE9249_04898 [Paenibacillus sp. CECT 9249]